MRKRLSILALGLAVVLAGAISAGAQVFHLQIDHAVYGKSGKGKDVTIRVRHLVQNNALDFKVTNANMGGDPNVGADKNLIIKYTYRGKQQVATFKEGERCRLP